MYSPLVLPSTRPSLALMGAQPAPAVLLSFAAQFVRLCLLLAAFLMGMGFAQGTLPPGFHHGSAQAGDVRLHYVRGGQGDPVLLVHGWPTTWYEWHEVMPLLAKKYDVIAVDLRGAGGSDKPPSGYDKRTMATDLGLLIKRLGVGPVHYVGHDIGGMVGYAFAHEFPELTRSYAILDVPLPGIQPVWDQVKAFQGAWHFKFHAVNALPEFLTQGRERAYIQFFMNEKTPNFAAIPATTINTYAEAYAAPGSMRAGFEYYRAFPQDERDNARYAQKRLMVPVLALGTEFSSGSSVLQMMKGLATNVQGGVVEGAGHWLMEEQPRQTAELLMNFFDRIIKPQVR